MRLARAGLWLCGLLSSCVVSSFSIDDELPAGGSSGAAAAGSSNGGGVGGGSAGSAGRGGSATQGGSAQQGGDSGVGESGQTSSAGASGAGGTPGDGITAPCDLDENGMPPLLCDDFAADSLSTEKWQTPTGFVLEMTDGPRGVTRAGRLDGGELASVLDQLQLGTMGTEVTISFWFKLVFAQEFTTLLNLQTQGAGPIRLQSNLKELQWISANGISAPSQPQAPVGLKPEDWCCVSVYLTSARLDLRYASAISPENVTTLLVDDEPTPSIDDDWLSQSAPDRSVVGKPAFGFAAMPVGSFFVDDVRIARDKSNVCGF